MPAPKGNQNALGNQGGRPPKYDLVKEAAELLAFSEKDECLRLYDFTDKKEYCAEELDDFAARSVEFALALKKAKERIAKRRETGVHEGTFNYAVWSRTARVYNKDIVKVDEEEKDREHQRKKDLLTHAAKLKELDNVPDDIVQKFDEFIAQFDSLRSNVKKASSNSKIEHKS